MASDIWLRTTQIAREETHCCHMGYSFWLAARGLSYAPPYRQDSTYYGLYYTSHGALAGTRIPLPPHGLLFPISSKFFLYESSHRQDNAYHNLCDIPVVEHWLEQKIAQWVHHEESIWWPIAPWANALTKELHLAHWKKKKIIMLYLMI